MKYCIECGTPLEEKFLEHEGMIPYCSKCNAYRFPIFASAISVVILNKDRTKTLFIKQYGKNRNILVAGYINKGENAEEAVKREMMEEIGVAPIYMEFQRSYYWEKSNALLFNYYAIVEPMELNPNYEIDSYAWFDVHDALNEVAKGGLAEVFYNFYYDKNIRK